MTRAIRRHYKVAGAVHDVDLQPHEGALRAHVDGVATTFGAVPTRRLDGGAELTIDAGGKRTRAIVVREGDMVHVAFGGRTWRFQAVQPRPGGDAAGADADDPFAESPMTGTVRKVLVKPGDAVAAGTTLFVVEAMKMEFAVVAPRDIVVDEVRAVEGDRVDIQEVIVTFCVGAVGAGASGAGGQSVFPAGRAGGDRAGPSGDGASNGRADAAGVDADVVDANASDASGASGAGGQSVFPEGPGGDNGGNPGTDAN